MCKSSSFGRSDSRLGGLHPATATLTSASSASSAWVPVLEMVSVVQEREADNTSVFTAEYVPEASSRRSSIVAACGWACVSTVAALGGVFLSPGPVNSSASFPRPEIERVPVLAISWTVTAGSRSAIPSSTSQPPRARWLSVCPARMGDDAMGDRAWSWGAAMLLKMATCFSDASWLGDVATARAARCENNSSLRL